MIIGCHELLYSKNFATDNTLIILHNLENGDVAIKYFSNIEQTREWFDTLEHYPRKNGDIL